MPTGQALAGFPVNPPWIDNLLCGDKSHDHLPEAAQDFVRSGCVLPQTRSGRIINGKYVYTTRHRYGVPLRKMEEVNNVGLRIWQRSREPAIGVEEESPQQEDLVQAIKKREENAPSDEHVGGNTKVFVEAEQTDTVDMVESLIITTGKKADGAQVKRANPIKKVEENTPSASKKHQVLEEGFRRDRAAREEPRV